MRTNTARSTSARGRLLLPELSDRHADGQAIRSCAHEQSKVGFSTINIPVPYFSFLSYISHQAHLVLEFRLSNHKRQSAPSHTNMHKVANKSAARVCRPLDLRNNPFSKDPSVTSIIPQRLTRAASLIVLTQSLPPPTSHLRDVRSPRMGPRSNSRYHRQQIRTSSATLFQIPISPRIIQVPTSSSLQCP